MKFNETQVSWMGWVTEFMDQQDLTQGQLSEIFQCNFTLVSCWVRLGQLPTRQMLARAKNRLALEDWISAHLAAGFVPPNMTQHRDLLLAMSIKALQRCA